MRGDGPSRARPEHRGENQARSYRGSDPQIGMIAKLDPPLRVAGAAAKPVEIVKETLACGEHLLAGLNQVTDQLARRRVRLEGIVRRLHVSQTRDPSAVDQLCCYVT